MRYVLTAYENAPEVVDSEGLGYAGSVKATMAFEADYLPNILEQVRYFLLSAGFDYIYAIEAVDARGRVISRGLEVDA